MELVGVYIGFAAEEPHQDTEVSRALSEVSTALQRLRDLVNQPEAVVRADISNSEARLGALKRIARFRQTRTTVFGKDLFFDPAWNILVDLYVHDLDRRRVMVTDACMASGAPATTGLRWLRVLEEKGFVRRHGDPTDKRRAFVELTEDGKERMARLADVLFSCFNGGESDPLPQQAPHLSRQ